MSPTVVPNFVNKRLLGIQAMGSAMAEKLNFPVRSVDIAQDLLGYCPYPHNSLEGLAWSAGYWSMVAGILSGDIEGMLKNETR